MPSGEFVFVVPGGFTVAEEDEFVGGEGGGGGTEEGGGDVERINEGQEEEEFEVHDWGRGGGGDEEGVSDGAQMIACGARRQLIVDG